MTRENVYRAVERMSLEAMLHELELLPPLIRDVVAVKKARIAELSAEIDRRGMVLDMTRNRGKPAV